MTAGFSVWLNLLRAGAAFVVLMSHWAYPRFTDGRWAWGRDYNLGSDAVVLFFVLSGFVIAYAAYEKDTCFSAFAFARGTRLWSVALPAILLTYGLDQLGVYLWPESYAGWWYAPQELGTMLVLGLTFSNEWIGLATRLGTNGPWWSLSYEVAYYALFAIAFYMGGVRRVVLLTLCALLVGPVILLLMPCWLMGVWLYRRVTSNDVPDPGLGKYYAVLPVVFYGLLQAFGLPMHLMVLTEVIVGPDLPILLRFSDEVLWNTLLAFGVTLHLWGMASVLRSHDLRQLSRPVAWVAGGSFSLYVVHYPLLQFLSGGLGVGSGVVGDMTLLILTIALSLIFAALFERPLPKLRRWIGSAVQAAQTSPSERAQVAKLP